MESYLQTFDYSIEHVSGTKNVPSDVLSRLDYPDDQESEDVKKFFQDSILSITSQDARQLSTILQKTSIKYEFADDTGSEKTNSPQDMIITIEVTPTNEHQQSETTVNANTADEASMNISQTKEREDLEKLQREDPEWGTMIQYLEEGMLPTDEVAARKTAISSKQFCILEGKLYHLYNPKSEKVGIVYPVFKQLFVQIRAMRIIYGDVEYDEVLVTAGIPTLHDRRELLTCNCLRSIRKPSSCLHHLMSARRMTETVSRLQLLKI